MDYLNGQFHCVFFYLFITQNSNNEVTLLFISALDADEEIGAFQEDESESSYFLQHEPSTAFRGKKGGFQV